MTHLVRDIEERRHGLFARDGRRLECETPDVPDDVRVPGGPVAEILGVLLDNARVHGEGTVRLRVRDLEDALAFDVRDEGEFDSGTARLFDSGHSGGPGDGIGLALARDLAFSLGGRVSAAGGRRPTTFTLLVPVQPVREDETGDGGG